MFFGKEGVDRWKGIWWKEVVAPWALRHPLRRPVQKHEIRRVGRTSMVMMRWERRIGHVRLVYLAVEGWLLMIGGGGMAMSVVVVRD